MAMLCIALKRDHSVLLDMLDRASTFDTSADERRIELNTMKNKLVDHLKKEDEELYPVLLEAAKSDEQLQSKLNIFAHDMDKISQDVFNFVAKYSNYSNELDFAMDLGHIISILKTRIMKEEDVLLKEYNRITRAVG